MLLGSGEEGRALSIIMKAQVATMLALLAMTVAQECVSATQSTAEANASTSDTLGYARHHGARALIDALDIALGKEPPQEPALLHVVDIDDLKEAARELRVNGAVTLRGAIPADDVARFAEAHRKLVRLDAVRGMLSKEAMRKPRGSGFYKAYSILPGGLQIRSNAPGRFELKSLDRRDGGLEVTNQTDVAVTVEPMIAASHVSRVLSMSLDVPWRPQAVGSLHIETGADAGDWRRDSLGGLFDDIDLELQLPDYQITAIMPIEGPVPADCATEFVLGSHRVASPASLASLPRVIATGRPGDVTLLNAKIAHRGLACKEQSRPMLYVVYAAQWLELGRDASREYWMGGVDKVI